MTELLRPAGLAEALELVGDGGLPLAGGTAISTLLNLRLLEVDRLVSLAALEELQGIEDGPDGMRIGASTTLAGLAGSELARRRLPHVALAAGCVGNPRVRSQARLGGALAHADPRQDLPPALMVSRAVVVCRSRSGERTLPIADLFRGHLETALADDELVTEVRLPPADSEPGRRSASGYLRFAPGSASDFPTVSVAASTVVDEAGSVVELALALGSVGPVPLAIETGGLLGARADAALVEAVVGLVRSTVTPSDDRLGSAEYKRHVAGVIAGRLLGEVLGVPAAPLGDGRR